MITWLCVCCWNMEVCPVLTSGDEVQVLRFYVLLSPKLIDLGRFSFCTWQLPHSIGFDYVTGSLWPLLWETVLVLCPFSDFSVYSVFWYKLGKNTERTLQFIFILRLISKDFWKVLTYDLFFFLLCFTSSPLLIRLASDFFILFVSLKQLIFLLFLILWFSNF